MKRFVFMVVLAASCGSNDATVTGGAGAAGATADVSGGSLGDGWQFQADATPPSDSWVWSDDAKRWVGPDGAGTGDTGGTVAVSDAAASALPDGTIAASDGTFLLPDGAVVQADGAPVSQDTAVGSDATSPSDTGNPPPAPGSLGGSCAPPNSCQPGLTCFAAGTPQAYCGKVGCLSNGECASTAAEPMCCVKYGIQSYCTKQFGLATACGTQSKPVGADCKTGGQSDCDPAGGAFCLQTQSAAQCIAGCNANNQNCPPGSKCVVFENGNGGCIPYTPDKADATPCAGKTIGGCGAGAWCIEAYPGDPLAYCATLCKDDAACAKGFDCTTYGAGTNGICQKHGNATAGQSCASDRFACQKGLFCASQGTASAVCSPNCSNDADCAAYAKGLNQSAYCWKSPGGPWSVCLPKGDKQNGENCSKNPGACTAGSWCIGGNDTYNPDAYCQKPCGENSDGKCPTGSVCTKYGPDYSGCQPDGGKNHGESCAGAATSCKAGHLCIGPQGGEVCSKICKPGAAAGSPGACPSGSWCSPWGNGETGSCIPNGAIEIGKPCKGSAFSCAPQTFCQNWGQGSESVCIASCGANKACPAGTDCKDYGQAGSYCQPAGGGKQGEACSNLQKPCAPGLACLSAGTPGAMCAKSCKADADCGDGKLYCATGNWGGWCVPEGTLGAYEVCYLKQWQCQKGLACIGNPSENPGAVCAKACSGFADVCGPGAKCQYYGNGQSWCQKTGKLPHGSICFQQQNDCDTGTLCVKGTPMPMCLQQCGFGYPACPTDSPCQYFAGSAVALCVPKDFKVGGPIFAPF